MRPSSWRVAIVLMLKVRAGSDGVADRTINGLVMPVVDLGDGCEADVIVKVLANARLCACPPACYSVSSEDGNEHACVTLVNAHNPCIIDTKNYVSYFQT